MLYYVTSHIQVDRYVPKDAPTPEVHGDSTFEIIIAATANSFGIISTTYFFIFTQLVPQKPSVGLLLWYHYSVGIYNIRRSS